MVGEIRSKYSMWLFLLPSSLATRPHPKWCEPYVDRSRGPFCDLTNLKPWQSGAQGVVGARTVYYAMGLQKAGTSLMGAALAARLGGGYENEAVYHCCTRCKQKCAACDLSESLSSDAYPTVPHFFMKSIDSYFCQCGHVMVRLRPCIERIAHRGRRVPCRPLHTVLTRLKLMKLRLKTVGVLLSAVLVRGLRRGRSSATSAPATLVRRWVGLGCWEHADLEDTGRK